MYKHLFGPVPSRRLGMSLGIDLTPKKVCTLDCVYCEVGKTTKLTVDRMEYIKYKRIVSELDDFMSKGIKIDYFTFSGSGEPTLNNIIGELISFIKKKYPNIRTALLTNGTLLNNKSLRSELLELDIILPSLDAASQDIFEKINRPHPSLKIESYIQGLIDLRNEYRGEIWLEILLLKNYNNGKEELYKLYNAIKEIKPDRIQLNTLDRPGILTNLQPLSKEELEDIQNSWQLPNLEIISSAASRSTIDSFQGNIESRILETIARRPCTLDDLHQFLGLHINEINKYLGTLEASGKITTVTLGRGVFYKTKSRIFANKETIENK